MPYTTNIRNSSYFQGKTKNKTKQKSIASKDSPLSLPFPLEANGCCHTFLSCAADPRSNTKLRNPPRPSPSIRSVRSRARARGRPQTSPSARSYSKLDFYSSAVKMHAGRVYGCMCFSGNALIY
ncbi:unnamed protein product [Periconia digitata]|uniref:Uncharacterized protein n=1 Tax=Periconia digitata TaxID=1303443 RepID=A0A9W4XXE8_9PLEO|nr:unnamed protein product [Periconia digitata]